MALDRERAATVLVVEDDPGNRDSVVELLDSFGHRAVGVRNGREAIEYLHTHPRPCLILLDLIMPEMSGYELMDYRANDPDLQAIPVVLMTGTFNFAEWHRLEGAVMCLSKPIDVQLLVKVVGLFCRHLAETNVATEPV
jgi:CheY-like chemotaxis protein